MATLPAQTPSPGTFATLLGKLADPDPDYRYMSLDDFYQILAKYKTEFLVHDYSLAARTVDAVIKALDDQNGEVQNLAIKLIGPLASRVGISVIATALEKLTSMKLLNSVDNSLPALALRNVIQFLPRPIRGVTVPREALETYNVISRVLIPRLVGVTMNGTSARMSADTAGLTDEKNELTAEAIDVLIETVRCYGPLLQPLEVEKLQEVVVQVLERKNTSSPVKKRAVLALAVLAPYLSEDVLSNLIVKMGASLKQPKLSPVMRRLYLNIMGSLARSIPHKLGEHLPELLPHITKALGPEELKHQLEAVSEGDDHAAAEFSEVREASLIALEAFLASCGAEMRPYTEEVISACLRYLKYDPNYAVDDDEDMEEEEEEQAGDDEDDEDDEFEDDDGFDDDDDASWKVRRCAAKTLYTLISTRSSDLLDKGTLYAQIATPLIKRFEEREESVRLEVIAALALLIRKTGEGVVRPITTDDEFLQSLPESRKRRRQDSGGLSAINSKAPYGVTGLNSPKREEVPSTGPRADLSNLTPQLVRAATKLLKGKQIPTKQATVELLDNLIQVQHGGLTDYFGQVMQPIINVTKGTAGGVGSTSVALAGGAASATLTTLRVVVLKFISDIAKTHSSSLFQSYLPEIVAGVVTAVQDRFYKISSEAIQTAEELVKAITPPRSRLTSQKYKPQLENLYDIIIDRTAANDADAEVRQKAIQALGTLLSRTSLGDGQGLLSPERRQAGLELLLDRLKNETTRLYAVRAIDNVAAFSVTPGTLEGAWIQPVALELCGQLRKANRALRGASVQALQHLIVSPATKGNLEPDTANGIVDAILPVITANDSHLLGPALLVLAQLQQENPKLISTPGLIEAICNLLKQSIGGSALESLIAFVSSVGQTGMGKLLMGGVLHVGVGGDPAVIGKVAGALFVASNGDAGVDIDSFIKELGAASKLDPPDTARQSLALAILGEIGLRMGTKSPMTPDLFLQQFNQEIDKVSMSAAVALGRAGAGNVGLYLPVILKAVQEQGGHQYLLLQSIREILHQVVASSTDINEYQEVIWDLLFNASQAEDNKAICAECIGRLAIIEPKTYIPKLKVRETCCRRRRPNVALPCVLLTWPQELQQSPSPAFRAVAIQAIRYTLPDSDEAFDSMLKTVLLDILVKVLQDEDMEIRRLGLTTLNSAAHNKPDLILPHLGELVPFVMQESVIKPELIREVQMGPFKHQVDDGLELRKSAYETLYALAETSFSQMSSLEFYDRVVAGIQDENDIRSICNLVISKLILIEPEETTRRLDTIAECYRKILSTKLKEGSVKQEVEKQDEANKSVLRVSMLLANKTRTTLPGVTSSHANPQAAVQVTNPIWQQYWEWVNKEFERQIKALRDETRETTSQ